MIFIVRRIAGNGDWIAMARDPAIYLSSTARGLPAETRALLVGAAATAVRGIPGIAYAFPRDETKGDCSRLTGLLVRVCATTDPERSGEIGFGPVPDSLVMSPPHEATTHGSPNPDDSLVPIVLLAPGVKPGVHTAPVSLLQVAPTLARWLGAWAPSTMAAAPLPLD